MPRPLPNPIYPLPYPPAATPAPMDLDLGDPSPECTPERNTTVALELIYALCLKIPFFALQHTKTHEAFLTLICLVARSLALPYLGLEFDVV